VLEVDRLAAASFEVEPFAGLAVEAPRAPHRHDYHELFWTRAGRGHHLIDGERVPVRPNAVTVVGRGQVHVFERVAGLHGAVVRFGDELLHAGPSARVDPGWLLARRGARTIDVPAGHAPALEAVVAALRTESERVPEPRGDEIARHLVLTLLLWLERWYDAGEHDDADTALFRRFASALERDFARHHAASYYADLLAVPQPALTRALRALTGKGLKELIAERVLLEGARLLRFTDLDVGEIAYRIGFDDRLYFSRAFKRRYGVAPTAYRKSPYI
jgi:AraC family transcriptional activator of pobA